MMNLTAIYSGSLDIRINRTVFFNRGLLLCLFCSDNRV